LRYEPDLPREHGHYVMVESEVGRSEKALVRQFEDRGGQAMLHSLNRRFADFSVAKYQRIWDRVVQLRRNL